MKKRISTRKLNRTTDERKRLFRGLIKDIGARGFVNTSLAKAKTIKPLVEKLVTRAKNNSLNNLRKLIQVTGDVQTAHNLLRAGEVFKNRPGGYTRIIRLGKKVSDNSEKVRLEWVEPVVIKENKVLRKKENKTPEKEAVKREAVSVKKEDKKKIVKPRRKTNK